MKKKVVFISLIVSLVLAIPAGLYFYSTSKNGEKQSKAMFNELKHLVANSIPSTVDMDLDFNFIYEGFEDAIISLTSSNENIISTTGKVIKQLDEKNVLVTITIKYLDMMDTIYKNVKVKPLNESEVRNYLVNSIEIPSTEFNSLELPVYIKELDCNVSYSKYAQRINGNSKVDEPSIEVVSYEDKAIIKQNNIGSSSRVFIVATFEYNGNVFSHNYPVYTK